MHGKTLARFTKGNVVDGFKPALLTRVISDFIKGEAGTTVRLKHTPPVDIAISAITVIELR
ncbi:MAG: hypothetical protein ACFE0I_08355 [Elainellaceae cyanobacterium]